MAHLEGLLEGLRESITGLRPAKDERRPIRVWRMIYTNPGTPFNCLPSTFSAACLACGRTLLVLLLAVLGAVLRSIFAASQNPPHPQRQ